MVGKLELIKLTKEYLQSFKFMKYEYINDYKIIPQDHKELDWSGSNGFCFDEEGRVCIVWEDEKKRWDLPGGGREGDENPEETFVREVKEETQCDAYDIKYFHSVNAKCFNEFGQEVKDPVNRICFRYICRLKNIQEFVPNQNGHEIDKRVFVSLEELPNYLTWLKETENGKESFEKLRTIIQNNAII